MIAIGLALSLVALATLAGACNGARQCEGVTPTALGCEASTGTSIAGQPAPYTCVDTGFRPDPHGFSFANWGGVAAGDAITTETLVALFGAQTVCVDADQSQCTPRPAAIQWAAQMNELLANGRCEGMSVAAERFFTGLTELKSLDGSAQAAADLSNDNRRLVSDIDYWWATQLMPEVAAAASASRALQPSAIVAAVTAGLRDGSANTMGLYSKLGAHAVTPFAVTCDEPYFSIWVYDSNHPGRPGRVLVDAAGETWHYQSQPGPDALADAGWNGSGPGGLEYTPMSVRMQDFTMPFSNDSGENAFALAIVATSADSSTEVDLRISGPGIDIDTADGAPSPEGVIVRQIDDDGIGHATLVYVRPSVPLVIKPTANEAGVPVTISIDGPSLPWQEVRLTTPAPGALPVRIEVSPGPARRASPPETPSRHSAQARRRAGRSRRSPHPRRRRGAVSLPPGLRRTPSLSPRAGSDRSPPPRPMRAGSGIRAQRASLHRGCVGQGLPLSSPALTQTEKEHVMSRRRLVLLALVVALAATALVLGGWSLRGRTVTVTHGAMTTSFVDGGVEGASAGDLRLFEVPTAVKGSTAPGRMDAVMTTTGVNVPDQGSEIRVTQLVFTFRSAKDQIVVTGASVYPAAGSVIATDSMTVRPIVGGSGTYSGANGWCESTHLADGTWRHVFHLER